MQTLNPVYGSSPTLMVLSNGVVSPSPSTARELLLPDLLRWIKVSAKGINVNVIQLLAQHEWSIYLKCLEERQANVALFISSRKINHLPDLNDAWMTLKLLGT